MKILGQGVKDISERYFHGMYVSAQGNPFVDGTALDGMNPLVALLGSNMILIIVALVVTAMLVGSYMYKNKQSRMMPTGIPAD